MIGNHPKISSKRTKLAVGVASLALALSACGGNGDSTTSSASDDDDMQTWTPYEAEPGDSVPASSVTFGMRPYADNTFFVIGMENGWFEDAGIELDPPEGVTTTEDQWINLLLNGSTDINSSTCSILVTSYTSSDQLKCIAHAVTFFGAVMFANPELGLSTVQDYIDEGQDFETALANALEPLTNADEVHVPPGTGEITFTHAPFEVAGLDLPNFTPTDDSVMFTQAQAGNIDFLHPGGAPIALELLKLGWTPIYDTRTLVDHGPTGPDGPFASLVLNNGLAATADFALANQDTILRFVSVMFRIAAETAADRSLFDDQAPYLNSVAGTNLTGEEIADLFAEMHPLTTFEESGEEYFNDSSSPQYYASIGDAIAEEQAAVGAIPEGLNADSFIWADDIYHDLERFKEEYEDIVASAGSDADQDLLAEAAQYYEWYNFLDAYRLAAFAVGQ